MITMAMRSKGDSLLGGPMPSKPYEKRNSPSRLSDKTFHVMDRGAEEYSVS
jgi:hypothetical protein